MKSSLSVVDETYNHRQKTIKFRRKILHHIAGRIKKDLSPLGFIIFDGKMVPANPYDERERNEHFYLFFFRKKGWFSRERLIHIDIIYPEANAESKYEQQDITNVKLFVENKDVIHLLKNTLEDLKKKYHRFLRNAKIEILNQDENAKSNWNHSKYYYGKEVK